LSGLGGGFVRKCLAQSRFGVIAELGQPARRLLAARREAETTRAVW
jgi:hypothetical protein